MKRFIRIRSLELTSFSTVAVIQMKDLTSDNRVCCDELARVDMEVPMEHHLVCLMESNYLE